MNPNEDPTFLCPECARRFIVDLNGGVLQHCPVCGNLCKVAEDVDVILMEPDKVREFQAGWKE